MNVDYDVVIVGGGLVGACLAAATAGSGLSIAVIEAHPSHGAVQPSYDERASALSFGSSMILDALGLWQDLSSEASPIQRIRVSVAGQFGRTEIDRASCAVPALGYVLPNRCLGQALMTHLGQLPNVHWFLPARLAGVRVGEKWAEVDIRQADQTVQLRGRLLVGADGTDSAVRSTLNIAVRRREYQQTAVIANVTAAHHHQQVAFERLTGHGPLALLPLSGQRLALVWTHAQSQAERMEKASARNFLDALQTVFGWSLGRFHEVGRRRSYPLVLVRAARMTAARTVLIGNAAHTLHPVAGQGFNLALRDVAWLAELLSEAAARGDDPGAEWLLHRYVEGRKTDIARTIAWTDGLVRVFAGRWPGIALACAVGLTAMDLLPELKRQFARQSMGLSVPANRLSRGLALVH